MRRAVSLPDRVTPQPPGRTPRKAPDWDGIAPGVLERAAASS
jgi:hypothetical protein